MTGGKKSPGDREVTTKIMTKAMHEHLSKGGSGPRAPLGTEEIVRIVEEMQSDPSDAPRRAAKYSRKYVEFMEQCPALFQKACRPGLDMNMLRFMADTLSDNGEEDGSSIVGARLAEKFVKPRGTA